MGIDRRSRWAQVGAVYVVAVASLVAAEQVTRDGRFYLAALLLTLPIGLVAITGVYIAYGITEQVVSALSSSGRVSDRTFALTAPFNVLLFAAAAGFNVWLLYRVCNAVRARRSVRAAAAGTAAAR